ncbi:hypothetical protein KFE25_010396 [Diacronema lutheri]|uniref:Uncharacterized protein n=2 Tax=Diacronema lutheri TaxID=2081491 RepID=A0A8J5XBS6_DIALT|nr:hypothetical protein KFE25_010396 [Diacronema lutheri]
MGAGAEGEAGALEALGAEVRVHHLPCRVKHTGPARVSTYFHPAERGDTESECTFRGRKLVGVRLPLPDGARGFVLRPSAEPAESPAERRWDAAPFSALTWWGADFPAAPGALHAAAAWLETAAAVHDDVAPEQQHAGLCAQA